MQFVKSERLAGLAVVVMAAALVYASTAYFAFWQAVLVWAGFVVGLLKFHKR